MSGNNVLSRKCKLRVLDALCCQPCGQSPRLLSVATGGRAPSAIARQDALLPAFSLKEVACHRCTTEASRFSVPSLQLADACLGQTRGALAKHRECVSPCRPVRCGRGRSRLYVERRHRGDCSAGSLQPRTALPCVVVEGGERGLLTAARWPRYRVQAQQR